MEEWRDGSGLRRSLDKNVMIYSLHRRQAMRSVSTLEEDPTFRFYKEKMEMDVGGKFKVSTWCSSQILKWLARSKAKNGSSVSAVVILLSEDGTRLQYFWVMATDKRVL